MAKLKVELIIEVRDAPFVSDTSIQLWLDRHLSDHAPAPLVVVKSVKLVGART